MALNEREVEVSVAGATVSPLAGGSLEWVDERHGVARVRQGDRAWAVIVEWGGADWFVTFRGRRIPVTVTTWRERLLAAAGPRAMAGGRTDVSASLPGLVVAVRVEPGNHVEEGDSLLTIEAMKMQNEVRAPRAGRVAEVSVGVGETVSTGALLVRLEEA